MLFSHNVIIPKRGRDDHFEVCMVYLNKAAAYIDTPVNVYVVTETDFKIKAMMLNLNIVTVPIDYDPVFCRAKFLNVGLAAMSKDFNYVSIIDGDMIYRKDFFRLVQEIDTDTYFISGGVKLEEEFTRRCLINSTDFYRLSTNDIDEKSITENKRMLYPSQITLSKTLYHKILSILDRETLYDNRFIGWGGEDSEISFFSRVCHTEGVFYKRYSHNIWHHLFHLRPWDDGTFDKKQHDKNVILLNDLHKTNVIKIQNYKENAA